MPYAINLTLDASGSTEIERIYGQLAAFDISDKDLVTQYGPSVTLLVIGDELLPEAVARTLELRLPALEALEITFTEPCIIPGTPPTLSLRVAPTEPLLGLHQTIYSEFAEDTVHLHYRAAYWQPHLKLCNVRRDRSASTTLAMKLAADWRPLHGVLDGIEAVSYSPVQVIWRARLKSPSLRPGSKD